MNGMKVRVCLTDVCNFQCKYCRPGGEGIKNGEGLSDVELLKILNVLIQEGFEGIRLTGGEPTLRKGYLELAKQIKQIPGLNKLTMVTNGSTLDQKGIEELAKVGFKSITVSLDTINDEKFANLVGRDCAQKVIDNIVNMKEAGINVKINCVASKYNIVEINELIAFCSSMKIPLKILDLVSMDSDYWEKEWTTLECVQNYLEDHCDKKDIQYQDEGFGTPEEVYYIHDSTVTIKDSTLGTCYFAGCDKCEKYPCQSGIVSMILSSNGVLKICSLSDKYSLDLRKLIDNEEDCKKKLRELMKVYNDAKFENIWYKHTKGENCSEVI